MDSRADKLLREAPALAAFLDSLNDFDLALPGLRQRILAGFVAADRRLLCDSIVELERLGVFPQFDPRDQAKIEALWESEFFAIFLKSIGFYPERDSRPLQELLDPVGDIHELRERASRLDRMFPATDFWRFALKRSYPEIYLNPHLPAGTDRLAGCDLACGWGRGLLSLRQYENRHIHCCDRSAANLALLKALGESSGLSGHFTAHRCEVNRLPFDDDFLDFTVACDIFELLTDKLLDEVLQELLRCHKPGAVVYCKATLFARVPSLGQVQFFTPDRVVDSFSRPRHRHKRLELKLWDAMVPEHFTFQVATIGAVNSPSKR